MLFFFFNDTATTEIYTLSLHDALPIWVHRPRGAAARGRRRRRRLPPQGRRQPGGPRHRRRELPARRVRLEQTRDHRSEEHTSELQSQSNLVCRLLLEKKKQY